MEVTVQAGIAEPSCSPCAALPASAQPTTGTPLAANASRQASRANVFPTPAAPSTTTTPAGVLQTVSIIERWSLVSEGRASNAAGGGWAAATPPPAFAR